MSAARDRRIADDYLGAYLPCRRCEQQTERETLSTNGGLCGHCFGWYVAQAPTRHVPRTVQARREVLQQLAATAGRNCGISGSEARSVAVRLRAMESGGMRLTDGQRWVLDCCEKRAGISRADAMAEALP